MYHPNKPYNDLPLLPPKLNIETLAVLRKTIKASRALSELKTSVYRLPNPLLLLDSIQILEAQASSEIENIVTSNEQIFKATVSEQAAVYNVREVMHYKEALWHGIKQLEKKPVLNTNLFISIMQIIKNTHTGIRTTGETKLINPHTDKVVYTPPSGEKIIRDKLKNLEEYIHADDDVDPLIKMAIIHYQFEAIHPFYDGNGRTGRIILMLYLRWSGLLELPAMYLSKEININKNEYYKKLRAVTEKKEWEAWVLYILNIIEQAANNAKKQIEEIEVLKTKMSNDIKKKLPKIYSHELMESLFRLPYTKRQNLVQAGIGNLKTVGNYLMALEEKGFLRSEQVGKEKLYLNWRLMNLLK